MNDALGDRMKQQYEDRTRVFLPRRTYTVIRLDGKAFHTLTRGLRRPFDPLFAGLMDGTAVLLCEQIQGAKMAFVQSDEISVLLTDFEKPTTDAWFDGNVQKMASVSASIATAAFNGVASVIPEIPEPAVFDARVFTIPDRIEVGNYFVWRQKDATRNSISMAAQSVYSHKELHGKSQSEMQEMLYQKEINWNDYPPAFKRGRVVQKVFLKEGDEERSHWKTVECPIFTQDFPWLFSLIPEIPRFEMEAV